MTDSRPVSMQRIADALGVSRATVSNALAGKGRLSEELATRIRETARSLGYVPSHAGRSLRTGRSMVIGLVVPDFTIPLFPVFAQAFERAAKRRGMAMMVADAMGSPEGQTEEILAMCGRGIDAVVVIPMRGSRLDTLVLPVPMVVVDSAANPLNTASGDHRDGGRQVARHLLELGHRRVALIESAEPSAVSLERVGGMEEVLLAAGARLTRHKVPVRFEAARDFGLGFDIDPAEGPITACACAYDVQAVGLQAAMAARGIAVPGRLSITGHDDTIWSRIVTPQITSLRQDLPAIAEHALAVAAGESAGQQLFAGALLPRGSSAPPPSSAQPPQDPTE